MGRSTSVQSHFASLAGRSRTYRAALSSCLIATAVCTAGCDETDAALLRERFHYRCWSDVFVSCVDEGGQVWPDRLFLSREHRADATSIGWSPERHALGIAWIAVEEDRNASALHFAEVRL